MTEFWVSQSNKWCEYCRCWLKDSAQSWAVHERGAKHQENVTRSECPSAACLLRMPTLRCCHASCWAGAPAVQQAPHMSCRCLLWPGCRCRAASRPHVPAVCRLPRCMLHGVRHQPPLTASSEATFSVHTSLPGCSAELREMRQKADRDKKEEAELAASMDKVEAEVGGWVGGCHARLGCWWHTPGAQVAGAAKLPAVTLLAAPAPHLHAVLLSLNASAPWVPAAGPQEV